MSETAEKYLTPAQLARVECLRAAREALVAKSTSGGAMFQGAASKTTAPHPIDLVNLARYVELGVDPYATAEDPLDRMDDEP